MSTTKSKPKVKEDTQAADEMEQALKELEQSDKRGGQKNG